MVPRDKDTGVPWTFHLWNLPQPPANSIICDSFTSTSQSPTIQSFSTARSTRGGPSLSRGRFISKIRQWLECLASSAHFRVGWVLHKHSLPFWMFSLHPVDYYLWCSKAFCFDFISSCAILAFVACAFRMVSRNIVWTIKWLENIVVSVYSL